VYLMRNAQTMKLVKIITVLTHVSHLVDKVQIVELKTMLQFADAQEETLEIHSKDVENLQETRSVRLVEPIQIVKLDQMIPQFVNVNKTMSETHFKAAEENANLQETVHNPKNVNDSNVFQYVEKERVEKMLTAKPETTVLNVHVLLISLVMAILDVTLNVQNMTIARETRLVSNSNVETHVESLIQMYVVKEQTAKSKITNQFVHVQEDIPVIHSEVVANSLEKIFANQILVGMEHNASLVTIVVALIDLSVPAHLEPEETH